MPLQSPAATSLLSHSPSSRNHAATGLLTDLYQLTMAAAYWKNGLADREAVFHLQFRRAPFGGQYAISCGLAQVADFLREFRYDPAELEYLAGLRGADDRALFSAEFLEHLGQRRFSGQLDAVPEGTLVFAHQPLVRVQASLLEAQLVETALLTIVNFQTLIATKAARICQAAEGDPVLEFGLRRAQGIDGGISASRAAYVGGCVATSNVEAGRSFDIPVRGTHAHSWVMAFDEELEAFEAYASVLPNNTLLLVDTYDTVQGVARAIDVGRQLRRRGHRLLGVRLDSGDLTSLSQAARAMLNAADMSDAVVVASNDLDEERIAALKSAGAQIDVWGVGTRLATSYDQPALGGVYKLGALRDADGRWEERIKLSEDPIKVSHPGILGVQRVRRNGVPIGDVIYDIRDGIGDEANCAPLKRSESEINDSSDNPLSLDGEREELLVPIIRDGQLVSPLPSAGECRRRTLQQMAEFPTEVTRNDRAQPYGVRLESQLSNRKQRMLHAAGLAEQMAGSAAPQDSTEAPRNNTLSRESK